MMALGRPLLIYRKAYRRAIETISLTKDGITREDQTNKEFEVPTSRTCRQEGLL